MTLTSTTRSDAAPPPWRADLRPQTAASCPVTFDALLADPAWESAGSRVVTHLSGPATGTLGRSDISGRVAVGRDALESFERSFSRARCLSVPTPSSFGGQSSSAIPHC